MASPLTATGRNVRTSVAADAGAAPMAARATASARPRAFRVSRLLDTVTSVDIWAATQTSFGSPAVSSGWRPVALRARLATGVPLSGGTYLSCLRSWDRPRGRAPSKIGVGLLHAFMRPLLKAGAGWTITRARMRAPSTSPSRREPDFRSAAGGTLSPLPLRADVRNPWGEPGHGGPPAGPGREPAEGALGSYVRAVRTHLVLVIAVMLAAGVAALAWGQLRSASYEATAEMLVNPLSGDDSAFLGLPLVRDTGDPPRTLQTAATLIDSPKAAQLTARRLGNGWTQSKVQHAVDVQPQGQSSIVDVTAKAGSANESAHVANVYVKAVVDSRKATLGPLIDRSIATTQAQLARLTAGSPGAVTLADRKRQLENVRDGDPTISISQVASPPDSSSGISLPIVFVLSLVGGLALGTLAALALDLVRPLPGGGPGAGRARGAPLPRGAPPPPRGGGGALRPAPPPGPPPHPQSPPPRAQADRRRAAGDPADGPRGLPHAAGPARAA